MARAALANRCIFIEADKRFKETDIKQIFSNVVQLTALKKETTDDDDQIKWILLFTTEYGTALTNILPICSLTCYINLYK
jgi:hypothetical protein